MKRPHLQFKDDNGINYPDWEEKKLLEVCERIKRKNDQNCSRILTISARSGLVSQGDFFNNRVASKDLSGYYLLTKDDFAYNKSYSNGYPMGAIKRLKLYDKGVVSSLYICFRFHKQVSTDFMEQYFEAGLLNYGIEMVAQEGARNHGLLNIALDDFFGIQLFIPSLPEQQKIASFLIAVDEKIELLSRKKTLLEKYKKGVMDRIFSQELRFKDEKGDDFPEWESSTLGSITEKFSKKNSANNPYIVYSVTNSAGFIKQTDHFEDRVIASNDLTTYKIVKRGDWAYNPARVNVGSIAQFKHDFGIISSLYVCFRSKEELYDDFLLYFLQLDSTKSMIASYGEGGVRIYLWYDLFAKIPIDLPSIPEQQKIADFLCVIDKKIELTAKKIEHTKQYKKGLLQQMFV